MSKRIFLSIVLSLCIVQSGAFAANQRGSARGTNNAATGQNASGAAPVAARAATRNTASVAKTNSTAPVSARAATRQQNVTSSGAKNTTGATPVAARAASSQKVINNGTKVASATANTVINQECQNAFNGCMDSFCMLDNASGGRCQCSDRNAELLQVMDDIAKLDEQSYLMATEGVERIQMGESADEIMARAKTAGDLASGNAAVSDNAKRARGADLNLWNNSVFDETEDLFEDLSVDTSGLSGELEKTGNALYASTVKMCVSQMPTQCKGSVTILQNMYVQKIKSDCMAFENSLKQQKNTSTQKLLAAEKALRDAASEKFNDENKYNLGGCVQRYSQCMQNECGNDYSKCITFAAEENIKGNSKNNLKDRTIKGVVDIVLSGATMNQLMGKKTICDDDVLVHCVKYRDQVWDRYLVDAATTLKSAEINAEDNLRQNCITDLASCFQTSCAAQYNPDQDSASYDMCLSDPMLVADLCKVKLDACIVATGGTSADSKEGLQGSRLWTGVTSMLNAMRVDQCTRQVKSGIESICGADFAYCLGLQPNTIAGLLPTDSLTACKEENKGDSTSVLDYIAEIAQGYALQMNSKMYAACEAAAKDAMIKTCGDSETCDSLDLGNMSFDGFLTVQLCTDSNTCGGVNSFSQNDIIMGNVKPHIRNRINVNAISYYKDLDEDKCIGVKFDTLSSDEKLQCYKGFEYNVASASGDFLGKESKEVDTLLKGLNTLFNNKMAVILKDKNVSDCMSGKSEKGFKTKDGDVEKLTENEGVFPNLVDSYQEVLIAKTLELLKQKYAEAEKNLQPQIDALNLEISQRLSSIAGVKQDVLHDQNEKACANKAVEKNKTYGFTSLNSEIFDTGCGYFRNGKPRDSGTRHFAEASYDRTTSTCSITVKDYPCKKVSTGCCWEWDKTGQLDEVYSTVEQMPTLNVEDLVNEVKKSQLPDPKEAIRNGALRGMIGR